MTLDTLTAAQATDLLPSYALGAVPEPERTQLESYLASHPEIEAELVALRHVAAQLRSDTGPRPELWDRIAAQLADHHDATEDPLPETNAVVVSLHEHRRRVPRRVVAVAAASFALLTGVAAAVTLGAHDPPSTPVAGSELSEAANAARTAPGAQHGKLTAQDGASADVVVLPSRTGYVLAVDIPRGVTYRLLATTAHGTVLVATLNDQLVPVVFDLPDDTTGLLLSNGAPPAPLPGPSGAQVEPPTPPPTTADTTPTTPATTPATTAGPAVPGPDVAIPPTPDAPPVLPPLGGLVPFEPPPAPRVG